MHLNFLDTSPLKVFALCLRTYTSVYRCIHLYADVNASTKGDIGFCIHTQTFVYNRMHFICD